MTDDPFEEKILNADADGQRAARFTTRTLLKSYILVDCCPWTFHLCWTVYTTVLKKNFMGGRHRIEFRETAHLEYIPIYMWKYCYVTRFDGSEVVFCAAKCS